MHAGADVLALSAFASDWLLLSPPAGCPFGPGLNFSIAAADVIGGGFPPHQAPTVDVMHLVELGHGGCFPANS